MMAKYFATSLAIEKGRQRAARHQQLFADLDDLDQLRRVRVEIDHVAGFFRSHRAGVHRYADIGLSKRRRIVGAVAGHRYELAFGLFAFDERHLVFGPGFGEKIIDAGLAGDGGGGQGIIAGDHHGLDAHASQLIEAFAHAAFDNVFQMNDAEGAFVIGNHQRRAARRGDALNNRLHLQRHHAAFRLNELGNGISRAFANRVAIQINATHSRLRRERNEMRFARGQLAPAQIVFRFGEHDDGAAFGGFVRK
jgi:hypothetical protein